MYLPSFSKRLIKLPTSNFNYFYNGGKNANLRGWPSIKAAEKEFARNEILLCSNSQF